MKIALVHHFPLKDIDNATPKHFLGIANILREMGIDVEFFVLSNRNAVSTFNGYRQHEVKGFIYPNHSTPLKVPEFISLTLVNKRPLMWAMNRTNKLVQRIEIYSPDVIIIGDFVLSKMFRRYKKSHKAIKIISLMDSPEMIYSNLNSITNTSVPIKNIIKKTLRHNYIKYNLKMFQDMADISDVVVTSADTARVSIIKEFPKYQKKVIAISPYFVSEIDKKKKFAIKRNINKVLFIGSYAHGPNMEAIENIRIKISPRLPKKKFFIAGKGCPISKEGNIIYLGTVSDLPKLLNSVDLCISPNATGSGRKAKVFDYLSAHKAILGTSIAFEGYEIKNNENVIIEDDINKFPERVMELDRNTKLLIRIQKNTQKVIEKYSQKNIASLWMKVLTLVIATH